jgi:hypothetical protein
MTTPPDTSVTVPITVPFEVWALATETLATETKIEAKRTNAFMKRFLMGKSISLGYCVGVQC